MSFYRAHFRLLLLKPSAAAHRFASLIPRLFLPTVTDSGPSRFLVLTHAPQIRGMDTHAPDFSFTAHCPFTRNTFSSPLLALHLPHLHFLSLAHFFQRFIFGDLAPPSLAPSPSSSAVFLLWRPHLVDLGFIQPRIRLRCSCFSDGDSRICPQGNILFSLPLVVFPPRLFFKFSSFFFLESQAPSFDSFCPSSQSLLFRANGQ